MSTWYFLTPVIYGAHVGTLILTIVDLQQNLFRKRVDCLEQLLAEERQKVAAYEKKLFLVSTETLSSAMSDDVKLHEREKEILQADVSILQTH